MSLDPAEVLALRRYALIAEAANPRLTARERGQLVREVAARVHERPDGSPWVVSRTSLDRWLRWYRTQGFEGLKRKPRGDAGVVRRHPELIEEAVALRLEHPARSAAHIADILFARHGVRVAERTVSKHLRRRGLDRQQMSADTRAFGQQTSEDVGESLANDYMSTGDPHFSDRYVERSMAVTVSLLKSHLLTASASTLSGTTPSSLHSFASHSSFSSSERSSYLPSLSWAATS